MGGMFVGNNMRDSQFGTLSETPLPGQPSNWLALRLNPLGVMCCTRGMCGIQFNALNHLLSCILIVDVSIGLVSTLNCRRTAFAGRDLTRYTHMTTMTNAVPATTTSIDALSLELKTFAEGAHNANAGMERSALALFANVSCAVGTCYVKHSAVRSGENQSRLTVELVDIASAIHKALPEGSTLTFNTLKQYATYANRFISEGSSKYTEVLALAARRGSPSDLVKAFDKAGYKNVKAIQTFLYPPKGGNDGGKTRKPYEKVSTFVKGLGLSPSAFASALLKALKDTPELTALKAQLAKKG